MNKENALKILEMHYKTLKEQKDAWNFFLSTAEYIKFIQQDNNFTESIRKLGEQQKRAYEEFNQIDQKAIEELKNAEETIIEDIKRLNINLEPVNNAIRELQAYNAGGIISSVSKVHKLDEYLFNIARFLKENGFENIVQSFIDEQKKIKNIYGNFTFSKTLPLRDNAEKELDIKRKTELWGAWEDLPFIRRIFFEEVDLNKEFDDASRKDNHKKLELLSYLGVKHELGSIRDRRKNEDDFVFFKVPDFRNKVDRIHKYLVLELLSKEKASPCVLEFDLDKSLLVVDGQEVKIQKFSDQYNTLKIIFDNPNGLRDERFFSDISEKYDHSGCLPDKKFYNAIYQVNLKLKSKGIEDVFIATRQSVKINQEYLS